MVEPLPIVKVQVCYATPQRQFLLDVSLPAGSTVHQAIKACGVLQLAPESDLSVWRVGVFSKLKMLDSEVLDHDRVEIYRPLIADPMESRRRRAAKRHSESDN
jgi:putative ubiquitin-RnfH superfamily antitoxin RatB of RatAB toxin-antitoxin module